MCIVQHCCMCHKQKKAKTKTTLNLCQWKQKKQKQQSTINNQQKNKNKNQLRHGANGKQITINLCNLAMHTSRKEYGSAIVAHTKITCQNWKKSNKNQQSFCAGVHKKQKQQKSVWCGHGAQVKKNMVAQKWQAKNVSRKNQKQNNNQPVPAKAETKQKQQSATKTTKTTINLGTGTNGIHIINLCMGKSRKEHSGAKAANKNHALQVNETFSLCQQK